MQSGSHPASAFRRPLKALLRMGGAVPEGVVDAAALVVTAGAGRSVDVSAGEAFISGSASPLLQGCYHVVNDATLNVPITAADATNPRNDLIVARVRDIEYGDAVSAWAIEAIPGAPNATPVDPALPANSIPLARVVVGAGVTTIVAANIADRCPIISVARGALGMAVVLSASPVLNTTTATDIPGLSVTFTLATARRVQVSFTGMVMSTVAGDNVEFGIYRSTGAAPGFAQDRVARCHTANEFYGGVDQFGYDPGVPAGTTTYTVRGRRRSGTGTCTLQTNSAYPAILLVEDLGASR